MSFLTPASVHYGRTDHVLEIRHRARVAAFAAHPERFVNGPPRRETLSPAVWINPPTKTARQDAPGAPIVTPEDPQHGVFCWPRPTLDDRSIELIEGVGSIQ